MSSLTKIRELNELITDGAFIPWEWRAKVVINDDNMCYVVWNKNTLEGIVVDPVKDDIEELKDLMSKIEKVRWIIIDTHTHADHISCAADLARHFGAPLVMHQTSPSKRVDLRISRDTALPLAAAALHFIQTPGHTVDSLTVLWGPFVFTADTVLFNDSGRDDLPGGDPAVHFDSLKKLKDCVSAQTLMCAGHDSQGGRVSTWQTQLKENPSLKQERTLFIEEASVPAPPPRLLKESLYENFK